MSKRAEIAALKAYPPKKFLPFMAQNYRDKNKAKRVIYRKGYEQAEKDLALSWEDVQAIIYIFFSVSRDEQFHGTEPQYFCDEILRRFNEQRTK